MVLDIAWNKLKKQAEEWDDETPQFNVPHTCPDCQNTGRIPPNDGWMHPDNTEYCQCAKGIESKQFDENMARHDQNNAMQGWTRKPEPAERPPSEFQTAVNQDNELGQSARRALKDWKERWEEKKEEEKNRWRVPSEAELFYDPKFAHLWCKNRYSDGATADDYHAASCVNRRSPGSEFCRSCLREEGREK